MRSKSLKKQYSVLISDVLKCTQKANFAITLCYYLDFFSLVGVIVNWAIRRIKDSLEQHCYIKTNFFSASCSYIQNTTISITFSYNALMLLIVPLQLLLKALITCLLSPYLFHPFLPYSTYSLPLEIQIIQIHLIYHLHRQV